MKAATAASGLGDQFSGHSDRVGLGQQMTAAGAPGQAVIVQGRWKDPRTVARRPSAMGTPFQSAMAKLYGQTN